jgi:hypothetical protein
MQYATQTGKEPNSCTCPGGPRLNATQNVTTKWTKNRIQSAKLEEEQLNSRMLSASQRNEPQAIKCEERIARSLPHAYNTCSDQSHPLIQTPGISKTLNHTCNPLTPRTCRWEREPEVRSEAAPPGTVRSAGAEGEEWLPRSWSDREGSKKKDGAGRGMNRLSPSGSRGARRRGGRRRGRA